MKKFRKQSIRSVAKALGVSSSYLNQVEQGERAASSRLISAAAAYYGVSELDIAKSVEIASPPELVRDALKDPRWWDVICKANGNPRAVHQNV